MNAATLIVYIFAFGIGCMSLALAIVYQIQRVQKWVGYLIACLSSCLACIILLLLERLMGLVMNEEGLAYRVLSVIIGAIMLGNVVFLTSFIPYFTCSVIAIPWRNPSKTFFLCLSVLDSVVGIFWLVTVNPISTALLEILFVFDLAFCFVVLLRNLESISERGVRLVCITEIIVSAAMLPAIALTLVFPPLKGLMCGIYFLAFSITMMVYLFIHFHLSQKQQVAPHETTLEDLAEYHITEREFAVIQLIRQGQTNKEIASALDISVNTVNNHVANIFAKTKVRSRIDLLNLLKQSW